MKKESRFEEFNKSGDEEKKKKSARRREVAEWAMAPEGTKKKNARRREEAEKAMVTAGTIRRYAEEMGVSITKEFLGETVLDLGSGYSDDFQREAAKKGIKVYSLSEALSREGIRNRIKAVLKRKYKGKKTLEDIPSVAGLAQ
ncbi:hypothetical protein KA005_13815, partial [bacterium]|nr:hypothetical protein [bacterium]